MSVELVDVAVFFIEIVLEIFYFGLILFLEIDELLFSLFVLFL
jgi:hypothetical protein